MRSFNRKKDKKSEKEKIAFHSSLPLPSLKKHGFQSHVKDFDISSILASFPIQMKTMTILPLYRNICAMSYFLYWNTTNIYWAFIKRNMRKVRKGNSFPIFLNERRLQKNRYGTSFMFFRPLSIIFCLFPLI